MKSVMEENAYYYLLNAQKKAEMEGWYWSLIHSDKGLPRWLSGKFRSCRRGGGFSLWFWKIPWRKKSTPTQYSCLGNTMDTGALWATVHGFAKKTLRLSIHSDSDNSEVSLRQNLGQNLKEDE